VGGIFNTTQPTVTNGQVVDIQATARGGLIVATGVDNLNVSQATAANLNATVVQATAANLNATVVQATAANLNATVAQATAANLNAQVQGPNASGTALSGNPVRAGGAFNTTQPTVTNGQTVDLQATARGALIVATGVDTLKTAPGAITSGNIKDTEATPVATGVFQGVSTAVAAGTTVDVANYTITVGKTLILTGFAASASGAHKAVCQYGNGATFTAAATLFGSAANQNAFITFPAPIVLVQTATITNVKVTMTNRAGAAQDLYAYIYGYEQ
jgi:hypothetical protein